MEQNLALENIFKPIIFQTKPGKSMTNLNDKEQNCKIHVFKGGIRPPIDMEWSILANVCFLIFNCNKNHVYSMCASAAF